MTPTRQNVLLGLAIAALAFAVQAEMVISVDLGSSISVGTGTAGVVATTGWQQKAASPDLIVPSSLKYENGSVSGASVVLDCTGNINSIGAATTDGDYSMFNRGMGIGAVNSKNISNPYNVRITGLDTAGVFAGGYDVYVYFGSGINYSGVDVVTTVDVSNGADHYFLNVSEALTTYAGSYVQGTATRSRNAVLGNYVKFSNMTGATFDIFALASVDSDSVATITGLQIVAVPESATAVPEPVAAVPESATAVPEPDTAVPEPVTVGVLGLGLLVVLLVCRVRA